MPLKAQRGKSPGAPSSHSSIFLTLCPAHPSSLQCLGPTGCPAGHHTMLPHCATAPCSYGMGHRTCQAGLFALPLASAHPWQREAAAVLGKEQIPVLADVRGVRALKSE